MEVLNLKKNSVPISIKFQLDLQNLARAAQCLQAFIDNVLRLVQADVQADYKQSETGLECRRFTKQHLRRRALALFGRLCLGTNHNAADPVITHNKQSNPLRSRRPRRDPSIYFTRTVVMHALTTHKQRRHVYSGNAPVRPQLLNRDRS